MVLVGWAEGGGVEVARRDLGEGLGAGRMGGWRQRGILANLEL